MIAPSAPFAAPRAGGLDRAFVGFAFQRLRPGGRCDGIGVNITWSVCLQRWKCLAQRRYAQETQDNDAADKHTNRPNERRHAKAYAGIACLQKQGLKKADGFSASCSEFHRNTSFRVKVLRRIEAKT